MNEQIMLRFLTDKYQNFLKRKGAKELIYYLACDFSKILKPQTVDLTKVGFLDKLVKSSDLRTFMEKLGITPMNALYTLYEGVVQGLIQTTITRAEGKYKYQRCYFISVEGMQLAKELCSQSKVGDNNYWNPLVRCYNTMSGDNIPIEE